MTNLKRVTCELFSLYWFEVSADEDVGMLRCSKQKHVQIMISFTLTISG